MYDIRQFRPTLYLLIGTGITGFCIAARAPGLWLLSMVAVLGHHFLTRAKILGPLPSWAAAIVALFFGLLTLQRFASDAGSALLNAGQFLVMLQLIKLFQEGTGDFRVENRNYAWLVLLSLLLMVAASISTASLLFGFVLLCYLFLGLYCCLLFHLKSETESIRAVMTLPADVENPAALRQDERMLPSSMRRLTVLVAIVGLVFAVAVFVFFPRGPGQGMLGQLSLRPTQAMTGFSESVSFESVARITQSQAVAAYVEVSRGGQPVRGAESLYLRGVTLDIYSGDGRDETGDARDEGAARWQWTRTRQQFEMTARSVAPGEVAELGDIGNNALVQKIRLEPTGVGVLFAAPGAAQIAFARDTRFSFTPGDETLRLIDTPQAPIEYTVVSRGDVGFRPRPGEARLIGTPISMRSRIDPRVAEYARRPEVSGLDDSGAPLAPQRARNAAPSALDARIAAAVEAHLKSTFSYTLDLTDTVRKPGEDPIAQFLYDTKRGHCEYFAGAMVLMLQSLGIEARMVTGFRSEEFNTLVGRYVVRQSDAHAWVEVRTAPGEQWATFDPTSARQDQQARAATMSARFRRFFDYLEYTWADSVVAYNRDRRESLLANVERGMSNTASSASRGLGSWDAYLPSPGTWGISPALVGAVIAAMVLIMLGAIVVFAYERWKLRRRADRIGLSDLPDDDRIRLARQLGFYDDLLRMLEARGHRRPPHLTPLEFSQSLNHLPAEMYSAILRLTRIYYRVRYGRATLAPDHQRRVRNVLARIDPTTTPPTQRPL